MKKLILVTPGIRFNPMGVPVLSVNGTYMNAIAAAGGIPVMLGSTPLAEEYAEMAAGLVITGGESVHPTRYGETFMHLADNDPAIAHNLKAGLRRQGSNHAFSKFLAHVCHYDSFCTLHSIFPFFFHKKIRNGQQKFPTSCSPGPFRPAAYNLSQVGWICKPFLGNFGNFELNFSLFLVIIRHSSQILGNYDRKKPETASIEASVSGLHRW